MAIPRERYPAPARRMYPYGLFSELTFTNPVSRWILGIVVDESTACTASEVVPVGDVCEDSTPRFTETLDPGHENEWDSVQVYTRIDCSLIGKTGEELDERARLALEGSEQYAIEEYLWPKIVEKGVAGTLLELEQASALRYGQGVIHMSRGDALEELKSGYLITTGNRLTTKLGTPVVAGGGYDGGGIYLTGQLIGLRSDIYSYEGLVDPSRNDVTGLAVRDYLVGFDLCPDTTIEPEPAP